VKHGWVIGGKNHGYAVAQEFGERMIFDCCVFEAELTGQGAGSQVARRANLERYLSLREQIHQFHIVDRCDSVADAFDTEQFDGFANFLWPPTSPACINRCRPSCAARS